jgi:mitogen-activated protein kinase kinase kinase ANP1
VDNSGAIKLADFGASKTIEGLKTRGGSLSGIKGTPLYMAPEVIKQLKHGRHADIWHAAILSHRDISSLLVGWLVGDC